MIAFSPSAGQLERWLVDNPAKFERAIARRPELADLIDASTALGDNVRSAMESLVEAPIDIAARMRERFSSFGDTAPSAVVLDLMGLGLATSNALLGDDIR